MLIIPLIIITQHVVLGNDYPIGRFSLFLMPLFIINFGFLADYLMKSHIKNIVLAITSGWAVFTAISFGTNIDINTFSEWNFDSETKKMMLDLQSAYNESGNKENVTLGVNWLFEPTTNFYRVTKKMNWLEPVTRDSINNTFDYCYLFKDDLSMLENYKTIKEYSKTGTLLIQIEKP